jgi:uncharacterized protein (TIGR03032 family)
MDASADRSPLTLRPSRQVADWLAEQGASLAFTPCQAGKLFLVGTDDAGKSTFFERMVERPIGLCAADGALWVATAWQIWRFGDPLGRGAQHQGHDALFVPRACHGTGDRDVHDVAPEAAP